MIHDVKSRIAKLDFRPVGLDSCYLHTYNLGKLHTNPSKWWSKHVKTIPLVKIRGFRHVQVMLYILVLNRNASNLGHQQKLADIVYKKTRCQTFWVPHTSLSSSVVYSIGFLHHYIYIWYNRVWTQSTVYKIPKKHSQTSPLFPLSSSMSRDPRDLLLELLPQLSVLRCWGLLEMAMTCEWKKWWNGFTTSWLLGFISWYYIYIFIHDLSKKVSWILGYMICMWYINLGKL